MNKTLDVFTFLEQTSEEFKPIAELYEYSLHYDPKVGTPFQVFLDLVGYSQDEWEGALVHPLTFPRVLYSVGQAKLGQALIAYAEHGSRSRQYVQDLLDAEVR